MYRRLSLLLAGLLVALLSVSAMAQERIQIVYWTHNHAPSIPVNQQIIDEFMAANPDIEIIFDNAPHSNYEQKLLTAFAGGQGPDIFWAGDWMVPQFLANNIIAPAGEAAFEAYGVSSLEEYMALFAPGSLEAFMADGNVYTAGTSEYNTFSLIYNVDHFEAAGIPLPSTEEPMTWEEFSEIAAALVQTEDGRVSRVGVTWPFNTPIWTVLILEPMIRQLGSEIVDPATGAAQFNTPEMLRVMELLAAWRSVNAIDPAMYTNLLEDFVGERSSMIFGGPWAPAPLADLNPDLNWAVAPLPQFADATDRVTTMYAWAWYINASSSPEKQAAAWRFANALTSKQQLWWDEVGYVQARLGTADNGMDMTEYRAQSDPRLMVIFNDYPYGQFEFRSTAYFEISDILTRAMGRVLGGENPADVLEAAQTAASFVLE
ncbi:MAG: extracellular solute-binding protein [Anaerolineae bacterium]|jgi:ABC-type glycerol-3-phosphate transport system substrate-binding protein|nr:extracellular solute-binding protein [Anaerolineae bacterium]